MQFADNPAFLLIKKILMRSGSPKSNQADCFTSHSPERVQKRDLFLTFFPVLEKTLNAEIGERVLGQLGNDLKGDGGNIGTNKG